MATQITLPLLRIAGTLGMCISIWGCQSLSKPTGARFASVEIERHTKKEIVDATLTAFKQAGYQSVGTEDELIFESEGKEWMQLAYGSNISGSEAVSERVKVQVVDENNGTFRLQCQAYVEQTTAKTIEKEIRLLITRSGPYRDLLEQIAKSLTETP
jgi:hypothetical protein